jgi:hypothetical protein
MRVLRRRGGIMRRGLFKSQRGLFGERYVLVENDFCETAIIASAISKAASAIATLLTRVPLLSGLASIPCMAIAANHSRALTEVTFPETPEITGSSVLSGCI